ncbi:cell division protein FtsQ [Alcaligenaceae bacterium]|nr:cell division protein FtsQ [Alcaligenaceae bacterium]
MTNRINAKAHRGAAIFFGLLLIFGLGYSLFRFDQAEINSIKAQAWLDGSAGMRLNTALELPMRSTLETLDAAWRYRLLGQLTPQVQEGCPGWLFYTDGMRPPIENIEEVLALRISLMQMLATEVASKGVQLLIVSVPDKSRVESDALCGLSQTPAMHTQFSRWQEALMAAGALNVDLLSSLGAKRYVYYRTDVHLNQQGAQLAAREVAAAASLVLGPPGDYRYKVNSAIKPQERIGDLLVLAGLENAANMWRPAPDMEILQTFHTSSTGGLLDAGPVVEVMLAGSSNSRRSNFAEQLGQQLGRQVWNVSRDGGKFADALMEALKNQANWPNSLKLVIWEMSEMSLLQPLSEQERLRLGLAL